MKCLCYLGILKGEFSLYLGPVMLISQKITQEKRVVTDFRHLNVRMAKNSLAYSLVMGTFSILGNSKCEVLSVLDLKKKHFIHYSFLRTQKGIVVYCHILGVTPI